MLHPDRARSHHPKLAEALGLGGLQSGLLPVYQKQDKRPGGLGIGNVEDSVQSITSHNHRERLMQSFGRSERAVRYNPDREAEKLAAVQTPQPC